VGQPPSTATKPLSCDLLARIGSPRKSPVQMILWQFASVNADFGLTIYPNNPSKLRQSRLRRIYDETFLLVCHFVILHAVVLLTNMALTQGQEGCGQGIALVAECYEGTKVVEYSNVCCTPGTFWLWVAGLELPSLLRGYSHCIPPATGTHTTTNWSWDENCPSCGGEPPTCCNGAYNAGIAISALTALRVASASSDPQSLWIRPDRAST
jgi:hypothetical protein